VHRRVQVSARVLVERDFVGKETVLRDRELRADLIGLNAGNTGVAAKTRGSDRGRHESLSRAGRAAAGRPPARTRRRLQQPGRRPRRGETPAATTVREQSE
jgi:hypothetical protein